MISKRTTPHTQTHTHSTYTHRCFESVKELIFEEEGEITGMLSIEGEKIPFVDSVFPGASGVCVCVCALLCSARMISTISFKPLLHHTSSSVHQCARCLVCVYVHIELSVCACTHSSNPHCLYICRCCGGVAAGSGGLHEAHAAQGETCFVVSKQ